MAVLLNNLGIVGMYGADYVKAWALYNESLTLFREIGDRWAMGQLLNNLGLIGRYRGEHDVARRLLEESIAVRRALGDKWGTANSLSSLANLLLHNGEFDSLPAMLRESLELTIEVGDRTALAYCLEDYAGLAAAKGAPSRAIHLASAAASLRTELGTPLPAAEQQALDRLLEPARQALGHATEMAWSYGQAMSFDDAVALALQG
jgi:tetratricopeptide (TPR) repeat protein